MEFLMTLFESPAAVVVLFAVILQIVFALLKSRKEAKIAAANMRKLGVTLKESEARVRNLFNEIDDNRLSLLRDLEHLQNEMDSRLDQQKPDVQNQGNPIDTEDNDEPEDNVDTPT